ncbi:hypothetical protein HHL16_09360 [Pseudoflavitalea sp. G-6-1-2]|nr:hypothetical protein [Pseudoflavitalea sp. G-6-1-2]
MARFLSKKETITEAICALLIILFLYTGVNKMWDYNEFKTQMGRSPFIGELNGFIAAALPAGEMLLSLLLVIKKTRYIGLYLSFLLMGMFTGYIWLMLTYAPDLPCSCGGILAAMDWKDHLYFNAGFTVLAAIGMLLQGRIAARG